MLPRNNSRERFDSSESFRLKVGKHVQVGKERVRDVQVVIVTAAPAKRFAVLDAFEIAAC